MAFWLLILIVPVSHAQNNGSREEAYRDVANDLAKIQALIESVQAEPYENYPRRLMVTAQKADLRKGATESTQSITETSEGKFYLVIDKVPNWYAVQLDETIGGQSAAWINAASVVPVSFVEDIENQVDSIASEIYEKILNQVNFYKEKYKNNPYVKVSGFSVNIGKPISVTVSFEFKE